MRISFRSILIAAAGTVVGAAASAQDLVDAFERVQSSVVTLKIARQGVVTTPAGTQLASVEGVGSGVLISADGKILTAAHVVQTANLISVEFASGETGLARVIASEPYADVSLIQLERPPPASARVAKVGDSLQARVGEMVFVIGAPLGIEHTLTVGYISARRKTSKVFQGPIPVEVFQTDAAINQGNSGGPLFNMRGEVIGIVSHIVSQTGGNEGLGFAVTSNMATELLLDMPSFWAGVDYVVLKDEMARAFNTPDGRPGLLVQRVARNSPADALGIKAGTMVARIKDEDLLLGGDIVLEVMGIPVARDDSYDRISQKLRGFPRGEELRVKVLRAGKVLELSAVYRG